MEDNHNDAPNPPQTTILQTSKPKKRTAALTIAIALVVLLLAACGWLAWQLKVTSDQSSQNANQSKQLQSQIDDLNKKLAAALKSASTTTVATPCSQQVAIAQSVKDNIAAAISSKNTAALEGYMASSVNVVYAASEKGGAEAPSAAVADLDYLNSNAIGPWNFNIAPATITSWQAGSYKQYFQDPFYAGQSANKYVVSFGFDKCGKISSEFVAASADLLTP